MDPADPTPLRYLGELYRHHTGDWEKAKTAFNAILNMPADPLSRAVAFHGLGKITIHEGEFKKGLHLMEQAVAEYPLALAYRNLAVYWNSEGDLEQGNEYTQKALALDPKDPYNLVFAAVFMAASGQRDEALKVARKQIRVVARVVQSRCDLCAERSKAKKRWHFSNATSTNTSVTMQCARRK